jgi:hypothetical protein
LGSILKITEVDPIFYGKKCINFDIKWAGLHFGPLGAPRVMPF